MRKVVFLGVDGNDDPASGLAFARKSGVGFVVGADADSALAPKFTLVGYPGTVFIDGCGEDRQDRPRPGEPDHPRDLPGATGAHLTAPRPRLTVRRRAGPGDQVATTANRGTTPRRRSGSRCSSFEAHSTSRSRTRRGAVHPASATSAATARGWVPVPRGRAPRTADGIGPVVIGGGAAPESFDDVPGASPQCSREDRRRPTGTRSPPASRWAPPRRARRAEPRRGRGGSIGDGAR